jgi:hypothetical protein
MASLLPDDHDEHLTTGWEPDLDAADTVVRQAVLAHASWAVTLAGRAGRRWADGPGWAGGHCTDQVALTNWVIVKQPPVDWARLVGEVDELFPAGVPYLLVSPWPTPDLTRHRLGLAGHPPLMLRPAALGSVDITTDLELRLISTPAELNDAERVLVEGYPLPELQPFVAGRLFPPTLLDGSTRMIVAYEGGEPLATATAHSANGMTLVENVAAMPAARGRGAGAAVTWAATTAFADQAAVLIASDDGQPVYARLGYLRLERWTVWVRTG